ncbi:FtsK/SpoIIIE domain-containing protein [Demequina sp.]|uniref:FtsK/SpoIIIE domain-containing protein n=1 Tax=Demequina sp. TaxID=2050685 RepID=UPI003D106DCC
MRITAGDIELEVRAGVPASAITEFASRHGASLPERPFCGPTRLGADHPAGLSPLVEHARLTQTPGPDARPRPGIHLAVVAGPDAGAVATLTEDLVIGRADAAGLRLTDVRASAEHARLTRGTVRDCGSRNGTRAFGARVRWRKKLGPGATLEVGDSVIVVGSPEAVAQAPAHAATWGLASAATAGLSAAGFALITGHWQFAVVALAVPAIGAIAVLVRRNRRVAPAPLLDVTGTLGLDPLPPGGVSVAGPRGLIRAVTLTTGRPARESRQWEPWMERLPAAARDVVWLETNEEPPSWAEVTIAARANTVVLSAQGEHTVAPLPLVSRPHAEASARRIAAAASGMGIPRSVTWAELPPPAADSLAVRLGLGEAGPVYLDLVADGPHVLVAGTTGSGKSEALRTIVTSVAHDYSPQQVTFALIDFKGGAGLGDCAALPHVASVLTDLEPHLARRCLLALGAELAQRKRAAASAGASSYTDWDAPPPRIVVVVDEFQEIASADRDFIPQLAQLAAQGRSLGVHLVLATQRPSGAVGADVRANISTTLALRTASEAESRDLIGTAAAAHIPVDSPGRAVLLRGTETLEVQVAIPTADPPPPIRLAEAAPVPGTPLGEAATRRHTGTATPLWLPPLPSLVTPALDASGFVLGIADLPTERRREAWRWDPAAGPLVITGPPRSGRSSVLRAVGARATREGLRPVWVPADARRAVRTLAIAAETAGCVLLLDDAQRTLSLASAADPEVTELLTECLRRAPAALVVPPAWAHHRLVSGAGAAMVLAGLAAADDALWDVPVSLRGLPATQGRARCSAAQGWAEVHVAYEAEWAPTDVIAPLPATAPSTVPASAIGVGGDDGAPLCLPRGQAAVVGPAGDEREAIALRVQAATGAVPLVMDTGMTLGMPGTQTPRVVVCVRPTARSLREVTRVNAHGLIEPTHVAFRAVVIVDGVPSAVQVLPS